MTNAWAGVKVARPSRRTQRMLRATAAPLIGGGCPAWTAAERGVTLP